MGRGGHRGRRWRNELVEEKDSSGDDALNIAMDDVNAKTGHEC